MSADDIRVHYDKHTIVASGITVTFDGNDTYDLTAVNEVAFDTYRRDVNGYYVGTYFALQFKQDKRTRSVLFTTASSDKDLDETRESWEGIANRIYAIAIPRIANEMAARVRAGEAVRFGPLTGETVLLAPEGVKGGMFGKPVPWGQVTRTDMYNGRHRVLGRKTSIAEEKVIGGVLVGWWNSYALPTVVGLLKA